MKEGDRLMESNGENKTASIKQQFRDFYSYEDATLGRKYVATPFGSGEFFEQTEKYRYTLYPYLPELMEFDKHRGEKVLEIGVGEGVDHNQFAKNGAELSGIDLTPRHIDITRRRLEKLGLKSNLNVADAENLPFDDDTFDLVYSCGVLFLVPDIQRAIKEIYRVLKPGSKVIALFYNKDSFQYYLKILLWHGVVQGELQYLTPDKLKSWYAGDGFGYPPLRYLNKRDLKNLFDSFHDLSFHLTTLTPDQIPALSNYFSKKALDLLSRYFGYYITLKAFK